MLRQRFCDYLIRFYDSAQARSPPISPAKLLSSSVFLTGFCRMTCATAGVPGARRGLIV
jgi:hypothetical protein